MLNPTELKYELYDHYTDNDGHITIDKDPGKWSTGNGLLHDGLAQVLFKFLTIQNFSDSFKFRETVLLCQKEPGVYFKNPGREDEISQDNLLGVSCGSVVTDSNFNVDVEKHALKNFFIWNADNQLTISDFLGRHVFRMLALLILSGKKRYAIFIPILLLKHYLFRSSDYSVILNYLEIESICSFLYPRLKFYRNHIVPKLNLSNTSISYFKTEMHPIIGLMKYVERST